MHTLYIRVYKWAKGWHTFLSTNSVTQEALLVSEYICYIKNSDN